MELNSELTIAGLFFSLVGVCLCAYDFWGKYFLLKEHAEFAEAVKHFLHNHIRIDELVDKYRFLTENEPQIKKRIRELPKTVRIKLKQRKNISEQRHTVRAFRWGILGVILVGIGILIQIVGITIR